MRGCRGNLAIEFAILVPLFLLLAIGIFDIGMVVIEKMKLEFATEAAAKLFATPDNGVCRTPVATADYAAGLLGISPSNFSVATGCGGQPGGSVTANYTYTPIILPSPIDLVASACYPPTTTTTTPPITCPPP
jgi:Flp pilus assembly protein TadG